MPRPTREAKLVKDLSQGGLRPEPQNPLAKGYFLPNYSGVKRALQEKGEAGDRPFISTEERTITVPTDYTTIQEALDQVPYFLEHQYTITVDPGTYNEDIVIPFHACAGNTRGDETEGATGALTLKGSTTTPSNHKVRSILMIGSTGANTPSLRYFEVTGNEPTSDENASVSCYGVKHGILTNMDFSSTTSSIAIMAYGSQVSIANIALGTDLYIAGFESKHGGSFVHRDGTYISGSVTDYLFRDKGGLVTTFQSDLITATGTNGLVQNQNGITVDTTDNKIYNIKTFSENIDTDVDITTTGDVTAELGTFGGVVDVDGLGTGGLLEYDLTIGSANYGIIKTGNSTFGRTNYNAGSLDLDGSLLLWNNGTPSTSKIEFAFAESTNTIRFALPKSGVGNATYNPRSMLIAGPAVLNDDIVTVGYWQTNNSIFHNLSCDTSGSGADLGVQNDLEVEGDIYTDSIKGSTNNTDISMTPHGTGVVSVKTALNMNSQKITSLAKPSADTDGANKVFVDEEIETRTGFNVTFWANGATTTHIPSLGGTVMAGTGAGWIVPRAGDQTHISINANVTSHTTNGTITATLVNGTTAAFYGAVTTATVTGTGWINAVATFNVATHALPANTPLIVLVTTTGTFTWDNVVDVGVRID